MDVLFTHIKSGKIPDSYSERFYMSVPTNPPVSFRPVTLEDLQTICNFPTSAEELFFLFPKATFPLTIEQLQKSIDNRSNSTVILLSNNVVGFANFITANQDEMCTIGNVILDPSQRGKGLGQALIEEMCRIAIEKYNVKKVRISCFNENTKGLLLYTKLGFSPVLVDTWKKRDGEKVALIHLEKEYQLQFIE